MKTADALKVTFLALIDAMIADTARFGVVSANPFYSALVQASAVLTAAGDTSKQEDQHVVAALEMYLGANENYY